MHRLSFTKAFYFKIKMWRTIFWASYMFICWFLLILIFLRYNRERNDFETWGISECSLVLIIYSLASLRATNFTILGSSSPASVVWTFLTPPTIFFHLGLLYFCGYCEIFFKMSPSSSRLQNFTLFIYQQVNLTYFMKSSKLKNYYLWNIIMYPHT